MACLAERVVMQGTGKTAATALPGRSPVVALLVSLRPVQWTKNAALLAALLFAQRLGDPRDVGRVLVGVAAFCLLASAVYLVNDVIDVEQDRRHPEKRRRPIAAGELASGTAGGAAVLLAAGGLGLAATLGIDFLAIALGYVSLQMLYSAALKHVVVLDVFAVAAGFVLRVVAGAEAIHVPISNWLWLCTLLLSLFLALAKRRAELVLLAGQASQHRRILAEYSIPLVDQLVTIVSACTVLAYALYTLSPDTIQKFGTDRLKYTVPFALFGLFRYLYLVHQHDAGGQPERVLVTDRPIQLCLAGYLGVVLWAIYLR